MENNDNESIEDSSDVSFAEDVFELANMSLLDAPQQDRSFLNVSKILDVIQGDASVSVHVSVVAGVQKVSSMRINFE